MYYMRRRSNGMLHWHEYRKKDTMLRHAKRYHEQGDTVWLNNVEGSTEGLFFLKKEEAWKP